MDRVWMHHDPVDYLLKISEVVFSASHPVLSFHETKHHIGEGNAMSINERQYEQLMKPIHKSRVKTIDGNSHLKTWDVRAHLIRIFGFGGFSADMTDLTLLYETKTQTKAGKDAYKVAYRATMRLEVPSLSCTYTEAAVGEALMPDYKQGDCHDMAIKTAASQAFKRAAMNLGTQFGLSLYDNGKLEDVVMVTLDREEQS